MRQAPGIQGQMICTGTGCMVSSPQSKVRRIGKIKKEGPEKPQMILHYPDHQEQRDALVGEYLSANSSWRTQQSAWAQSPDQLSREGGQKKTLPLFSSPLISGQDSHWLTGVEYRTETELLGSKRPMISQSASVVCRIQTDGATSGQKTVFITPTSFYLSWPGTHLLWMV